MIIVTNVAGNAVAINPSFIESISPDPDNFNRSCLRTASGNDHRLLMGRDDVLRLIREIRC